MTSALLALVVWLPFALPAPAQTGRIDGAVVDSATGAPLSGVRVAALAATDAVVATSLTDGRGRFQLSGLGPGSYTVLLRRVGYATRRVEAVVPAVSGQTLEIILTPRRVLLDPVQVTGSRTPETALGTPVSVSVVGRREIAEGTALTPVDHIRAVPGMDFASKGLLQNTFAVRGSRGPNQGVLLMMADYRNAALPSIGFNVSHLLPLTNEDLERIEVVRGPGAALYGPDAHRGVVHVVTRSPFESRGATLSIAGGERSLLQATARFAAAPSARFAFKVSGDYFQGHDWAFPAAVESLRRDTGVRRATGEARLDWRPDTVTTVVGSVGAARAINVLEPTGGGAWQLRDWRYSFAQARLHRGRLFANVAYNLSDAGETYVLQTGAPIVDNSRFAAAQVQHGADAGRFALLYGVDGRWTDPRTGGTIHGRNEDDDGVAEIGGFIQARTAVSPRLDLVTAVRVDRNNRLDDLSVSPRAGVVFNPAPAHALRLTYNRAFSAPDPNQIFLDLVVFSLPGGLPYDVRSSGIPRNGFSFRRDCGGLGGLCMRSPFNQNGADQYLPTDATLLWAAVVQLMQQRGIDLSDVPAPDSSQVATVLRAWNQPARRFDPAPVAADQIAGFEPLRRSFTQTLELGYKGVFAGRFSVAADAYVNRVRDPFGARFAATPNVFHDSTALAGYLSNFRAPDSAARYAGEIAKIPVGTISPPETGDPVAILLLQRQGGFYTVWGADASVTATLASGFEVTGTYSWLNRNVIPDVDVVGTILLTVPRNKGAATVRYRHERIGLTAALQGRAVGEFRVRSAVVADRVEAYAVLDAQLGYEPPGTRWMSLTLAAYNLLDHGHREIGGGAELGRLVVSRVQARF